MKAIVFAIVYLAFAIYLFAIDVPPLPDDSLPQGDDMTKVTFAWDESPDHHWVSYYKLYVFKGSEPTTTNIYTFTNVTQGDAYLWVGETNQVFATAIGTNDLESEYSVPINPKPMRRTRVEVLATVVIGDSKGGLYQTNRLSFDPVPGNENFFHPIPDITIKKETYIEIQ